MKLISLACAALLVVSSAFAQSDEEIMENARQVFYGSRLKPGTVLLTGAISFENTSIANSVFVGGLNLGVAVNNRVSLHLMAETAEGFNLEGFGLEGSARRAHSFGAGAQVRSKAVFGGMVQLYAGMGYTYSTLRNYRPPTTEVPINNNLAVHQVVIPLGLDIWLGTFAGLQIEPFRLNFTTTGRSDEIEGTNVDLFTSTFSPRIGLTFLINSRKYEE